MSTTPPPPPPGGMPPVPPPPPGGMPPPPPGGGGMQPPPPPPPGYGPGPGYPGQRPPTNGMAIASLVVSLVALLCCYGGVVVGIVGAVLGFLAKKQIAERGQGGAGLAQAGFIIGIIAAAIGLIWVILAIIGALTGNSSYYYTY